MFFGHMFTIATDAIIWTSQPLTMCFDVFVFHNFSLVFMIFQGIFVVSGYLSRFLISLLFTIVNGAIFLLDHQGRCFCNMFEVH